MSFIWPELLFTLFAIPLLVWIYLRGFGRRRTAAAALGSLGILSDRSGRILRVRRHLPPGLLMAGLSLLFIGLARPQLTVDVPRIEGTVILAFDVSNSMAADDLEPTRLEAAQAAARAFVEKQPPSVRIGVVAFGGSGLIVQAPTDDQGAILAAVGRLSPQGGTSLGEGMFSSLNAVAGEALAIEEGMTDEGATSLRIDDYSSAVVLLMTDGENTERPDPLEIAQLAAEAGVRVYTIGLGSAEGAMVQVEGFNIVTRLDEAMLEGIASVTNGAYFRADDPDSLQAVYEDVDLQLTTRGEEMEITAIIAGLSTLLFFLGGGLSLLWFGHVP